VYGAYWTEISDPLLPCSTGLGDYTDTPLIGICETVFPSANCFHQTLWAGRYFSQLTMYQYKVTVDWLGVKAMT